MFSHMKCVEAHTSIICPFWSCHCHSNVEIVCTSAFINAEINVSSLSVKVSSVAYQAQDVASGLINTDIVCSKAGLVYLSS